MTSRVVPAFLNANVSYATKDRPLTESEFAETWAYLEPNAHSAALRFGASEADADDVAQEAAMILLDRVRKGAVVAALPVVRGFVHGVVWRLTVGLRRRARTCELAVETVPSQLVDPEIAAQHQLDLEVIDEVARAKLASEDLEVILGGLNGESSDELAERLGATPGAVRVRRHRAFRTLRGELRRLLNLGEAA